MMMARNPLFGPQPLTAFVMGPEQTGMRIVVDHARVFKPSTDVAIGDEECVCLHRKCVS
jgi:hypothetical protein